MHSRKQDYVRIDSPVKVRNQITVGVGRDSYGVPRHHSPRVQQRSLSPRGCDMSLGSRRAPLREDRSTSTERKDNNRRFGAENIQSGSPLYVQDPRCDERIVHKKYGYIDDVYYDYDKNDRLNRVYEYDHHIAPARMSTEKEYFEKGVGGHEMMESDRIIPVEERMKRGARHVPPDFVVRSNYRETGEHLTLTRRHIDIEQFEDEEVRYRSIPLEKRRAVELYQDDEKPIFHSRDGPYTRVSVSCHENFGSSSRYKKFSGTSSGVSRDDFPFTYEESVSLHTSNEHPRGSVKLAAPAGYNIYGQNFGSDARDFENEKKIFSYEQGSYTPRRNEHDGYLYTDTQNIVDDDYGHPINDLERRIPAHTQIPPTQSQIGNEQRDSRRKSVRPPAIDDFNHIVESYGDMKKTRDHLTTEKQGHSRFEFGRRMVHDDEPSSFGASQDHKTSHVRSNFGFGRDSGPRFPEERLQGQKFQDERLQSSRFLEERFQNPIVHEERLQGSMYHEERFHSPGFHKESRMPLYDAEIQRHAVKRHRMREEDALYETSNKGFKRKYVTEEDIIRHDKGIIAPSAWNEPKEYAIPYESGEEWIEKDPFGLHSARNQRFDHHAYRKVKRIYNERSQAANVASENWFHSQDAVMHTRRHPVNKPIINTKSHPKSDTLSYYKSNQYDRSNTRRHNKPWTTSDDCDEDEHAFDNPSEEWMEHPESEPPEDSEDFKHLVEEAFLLYSKRLNLNSGVRRRYIEQGKAGSLFCVACGKSASKEFLDTRRLVTHAFMSHKAGLRARHLGLHKAICVLMGWNSYVPCDTVTWAPDILPSEEALTQKEDLMLWPPLVVIHNISMTNNNPEKQKVVPIEEVEAFLSGKGFVGGKMKVCLGKPADQSVMLVKFLGTFTGLSNAERLHKYFVENKRGREEFERKTSNNSKSSYNWENDTEEGEKLEEQLLYGYLAIADDLDRLDFQTKKRINIKSKKEIQELANAPVKTDDN